MSSLVPIPPFLDPGVAGMGTRLIHVLIFFLGQMIRFYVSDIFFFKKSLPPPFEEFLEINFLLYQFNTIDVMVIVSIADNTSASILDIGKDFSRTFLPLLHIDIPFSCNHQE
jgi:hypothetical protein